MDLLETKILISSTMSDAKKGAMLMCMDIKDYFLTTPMEHPEFMRVKHEYILEDIMKKYNTDNTVIKDSWAHGKIQKGIPELCQAATLAHRDLKNSIEPCDYAPILGTFGLWKHNKRLTIFCLCIDNFGVKHWSKQDTQYLYNAVGTNF